MAKFKSNMIFRGVEEEKVYNADKEFDMTIKRAQEIEEDIVKQAEEGRIDEKYKDFKLTRTDKE